MSDTTPNMPFDDVSDFADADRGFIAQLDPDQIVNESGAMVFDAAAQTSTFAGDAPDTVNPSLWRQAQLNSRHGLYEVTEGIYQVRGYDLSNMTLVEGDSGVIVIDPLTSVETAAAALSLYRAHRGDRPVSAVIHTHSHIDHFGGVGGVTDGDVPIIAPEHFLTEAVSENVYAGVAMFRRAAYYSAMPLPLSTTGQVGMGLGPGVGHGASSLLPPTLDVTRTGQEETVDGVRIVFQMTPGTEAPSEMNFYFPDHRALCMAENASHNLHNILTLRGAVVRDARTWSRYLNEAIELFAGRSDVLFASHHWPTWGTGELTAYLTEQRDLYAYLHDQTLRLLNQGMTGPEIAEEIDANMPPGLTSRWHTHGYYGSVSHNVKAIYQRYLGWYDANPAHLWEHPPVEISTRYVDCMGGADAVMGKAREYVNDDDYRFAATLLNHVVFTEPDNAPAKEMLATVYEHLGYGAENATWRNCYLQGAYELRNGAVALPLDVSGQLAGLTIDQLFDTIAIRVNGPRAWDHRLTIDWKVGDEATRRTALSNGALSVFSDPQSGSADLTVRLSREQLIALAASGSTEGLAFDGDASVLDTLLGVLDQPDPSFAVVTP